MTQEVQIWFETVPPFSKRICKEKLKEYTLDCFMAEDGENIVMFIDDGEMIPEVIFHSDTSIITDGEDKECDRMEEELKDRAVAMAHRLADEKGVDLAVISVFDTVATVMGHSIQCVSMFSVAGYVL